MKTVKILRNVIHKAAVLKKDTTHKLDDEHADVLIKGEHAEEVKTGAKQQQAEDLDQSPKAILSRMKRPELLANVEEWNKRNTDKTPILIPPNASNAAIVELLLTAAGYNAQS